MDQTIIRQGSQLLGLVGYLEVNILSLKFKFQPVSILLKINFFFFSDFFFPFSQQTFYKQQL